jgi:hypothetical protein
MKRVINEVLTDEQLARAVSDYILDKHHEHAAGPVNVSLRPIQAIGGTLHSVVVAFEPVELNPRFKWKAK